MQAKERINILIACDKNYAPYYGVMLTSLFYNNRDSVFHIHWITDKFVPQEEKDKFQKLVNEHKSHLSIYEIDNDLLTDFPQTAHINYAAYYNLKASDILPDDVHRIIYLDGDMIINGDICPLWEMDLKCNACAQVIGAFYYDEEQYQRLGFNKKFGIYNNGVVVYDFDKLRELDFAKNAIKFIVENPDKVTWMDQDTINALLYDKTLRMPYTYNFQLMALTRDRWQNFDEDFRKQVLMSSKNPIVVHYNGLSKPWSYRYYGFPFGTLWDKYCAMSYWQSSKQKRPFVKYIKYVIKRTLMPTLYKKRCEEYYIEQAWDLR